MKFATAALIGAASACHCEIPHHCQKNWKIPVVDLLYKPLTGSHIQDTCEVKPYPMRTGLWMRKLMRETHVTGVEALYGQQDIVDDECFGEWMVSAWDPIDLVKEKMKDDFHSVSYDEWQNAGQSMLDMMWKNSDACHFEKIGDDIKHWCLGDESTCFKMAGVWERVIENIFPLMWNAWEFLSLLKTNDICYTDDQLIEEYATMWGAMSKNAVIVHGM